MQIKDKNILAIAPHLDDVELGAGGSIHKLGKENEVYYLGLSMPPKTEADSFMAEFWQSAAQLGIPHGNVTLESYDPRDLAKDRMEILQLFYDTYQTLKSDVVFIPNSQDIHQSHQVVYQEAIRAFKHSTILGYELPWNSLAFNMDVFIELDEVDIEAKQRSINSFHSQKERSFFSNNIITDLAKLRGKQIGKEFCECFELTRLII